MRATSLRPAILGLVSMAGAACATVAPTPDTDHGPLEGNSFVVRNVRVFDGQRAIERANVVVGNGRIVSVGGRIPAALPIIEGSGRTLFPGLIDTHGHVLNDGGLRNALRFGVTTVLDMFTRVEFAQANRSQRNRLTRTELADMYSAGAPVTSPGGMGTQFGIPFATIAAPAEAVAFVRARLAEGSDYIKILYEPGAGVVTTISAETLAAVVAAAHAQGALAVVHVSSLQGARQAVAAGADGLAHLFSDSLVDDGLARQMAARGIFVVPTLSIMAAFGGTSLGPELAADPRIAPLLTIGQRTGLTSPPPGRDYMGTYLHRFDITRALQNVRRLRAAGVRVLAGDDAPNLGAHGVSMHGELELLTRAGLTPAEALEAATLAPARAFRLADRGRIAAGARADLVLVEGNPLVDIKATRAIVHVFKNGYDVPRSAPPSQPAQPAAQPPAAPAASTAPARESLIDGVVMGQQFIRHQLTTAASSMSEDDYAFKPTPVVRTFGQILAHIADSNYLFCSEASGDSTSRVRDIEKTRTTKAAIDSALAASFVYCDAVYASMTTERARTIVQFGNNRFPALTVLMFKSFHNSLHYGNVITYMRLRGKVPPPSAR